MSDLKSVVVAERWASENGVYSVRGLDSHGHQVYWNETPGHQGNVFTPGWCRGMFGRDVHVTPVFAE